MRVTHIITRLIVGGAQENTVATVLGLRQKFGIAVGLISGPTTGPEGSLESELARAPDILVRVPELVRPVHPWKDWMALRRLTEILRQVRPDIVHTHSGKAGILGRLAGKRAGVPLILHTIHGPSFGHFQNAAANFVFRAAEKYAARATTHFVIVADAMKARYLAAGIGQPEQYTKIFSGFALEPFLAAKNDPAIRARFGLQPGDFVVGKIARLFKLKGHDDLFAVAPELVRRCPQIKFLLVGDGEWRGRFENLAKSLAPRTPFHIHRPRPARRNPVPGRHHGCAGAPVAARRFAAGAAAGARCRQTGASPTIATAPAKFVSMAKPDFSCDPVI